ncbi:MAG: hypothetical protein AAF215_27915 [Cyanobacteria bacterium P01_A01_bin.123]
MGVYDSRRLVSVVPFNGALFNYGFKTNIDTAQSAQLGHNEITGDTPAGTVIGANSPKPARASRRFASGTVSSFIDVAAIPTARTQGWRVGKAKIRRGGSTQFSISVYVTLLGVKYAWNIPLRNWQAYQADLTQMGVRAATSDDSDLIWGASSPKPPRAYQTIVLGDETNTISTFVDPNSQLADGWKYQSEGQDPLQTP